MNKTKLTIDEIAEINPEAMMADGFDDAILGMQCPTYFWLKKEKIKRNVIKPK